MKTPITSIGAVLALTSGLVIAAAHSTAPMVEAKDQDVSNGVVSASSVTANENGWMVVHLTGEENKPGPVVGYAPLREGRNLDVAAILQEPVAPGQKLMLMVHGEAGGVSNGVFEYTLGAKEDGPVRMDGKLVMTIITAR